MTEPRKPTPRQKLLSRLFIIALGLLVLAYLVVTFR